MDLGVYSAVITPDGRYILAGGLRQIHLLDVRTGRQIERFPKVELLTKPTKGRKPPPIKYSGPDHQYDVLAVSPDGKYVASASSDLAFEMPIQIWDIESGTKVGSRDTGNHRIHALAFSPDGTCLAAATGFGVDEVTKIVALGDYDILLFDPLDSAKKSIRLHGHEGPVRAIAFLPDGKRLVSASNDRTIRVWDIAERKEIKRIGKPKATPWDFPTDRRKNNLSLSLSSDGKRLAQGYYIWDTEKWETIDWRKDSAQVTAGEHVDAALGPSVLSINVLSALSPDAKWLLVTELSAQYPTGKIELWDVSTGRRVAKEQVYSNSAPIFVCAFSPDGRHALIAGEGRIPAWSNPDVSPSDRRRVQLWAMPKSASDDK